ncbi:MAG: aminotransferase class I/II-fold pyridoxal phosphate-dependent enzyme [Lachnospiraceae bacterium]|nr:aminotransferase class I/II-fold pyridoxal phosphate-dependent enzyme [Lachnospiraceae bacterium]
MENVHGGDIYRNHVRLDFSVNINPFGIPKAVEQALHAAVRKSVQYPDIAAEQLKAAVSEMLAVPEEWLLFGNGASELFMAIVHALNPQKTVIPVPSFYGYEYATEAAGGEVFYYPMTEETAFLPGADLMEALNEETDLLFLANPNNPTGAVMSEAYLEKLLRHCREKGIYVVLDECFIEFCTDNTSILSKVSRFDNLILVRAFTKIFAIPGVRLGYLVCSNAELRAVIGRQLPEWNISVLAQAAGCACAKQQMFVKETAEYVRQERNFLTEQLHASGITVFAGDANFLLLRSDQPLYERLLAQEILIRDCGNFRGLGEGYYRIAVRTREENLQLLDALTKLIGENRS